MDENERGAAFPDDGLSPISEVDITDDFMFAYIMRNPDICIPLLRYLLPGRNIERVRYLPMDDPSGKRAHKPQTQKTLLGEFGKRGVRLDAYLDDGKTVYNIEMQTTRDREIAKRARLYGAYVDINQLGRGERYDELKPCFVIFICKFDPFRAGLYRYSFQNLCEEKPELALNDESYKLFFNTTGTQGEIDAELRELLEYMNNTREFSVKTADNTLIEQIDQAVALAKSDEEWRRAYMIYQIHMREVELRGMEKAERIGMEKGTKIGLEKGEKIGLEKGTKIGLEKGLSRVAKEMLLRDFPLDDIVEMTGLSLPEVRALAKDNKRNN